MLLKKVFNTIFGQPEPKKQKKPICSIEFYIDDEYDYNLRFDWGDRNRDHQASYVAQLLFAISSGMFHETIAKDLLDMSQHNLEEKTFRGECIAGWQKLMANWATNIHNPQTTEEPLIKPSSAFFFGDHTK